MVVPLYDVSCQPNSQPKIVSIFCRYTSIILASVVSDPCTTSTPYHDGVNRQKWTNYPGSADIGGKRRTDFISKFWIIKMTFPKSDTG